MAGGSNPQNVAMPQQVGAGTPMSDAQFFNSLGIQPGANLGMQFNQGTPNLGGTMPSGNMSQADFRAAAMGGQAQQLPPGFTLPGGRTPGQIGPQAGSMQSPMAQPSGQQPMPQAGSMQSPMAQPSGQQPGAPAGGASGAAPNVFNQAAGAYNAALQGPNIGQFMNPYTSEVINRTGMDMMRQAQMAQNTLGAEASRAGAFGGSRHGVAQGTMLGDYGRAFGDIAAQQRQAGFNTALGAAQQQQGMLSQLAGQGFGFGQALNQQQMQQGGIQQGIMQQLIDASRGQYQGFTGAPQQALTLPLAALGASPVPQTTTTSQRPGLFNYLSLALGGL